jgi:RNA polymerase sigma factor (sigma-70 family)
MTRFASQWRTGLRWDRQGLEMDEARIVTDPSAIAQARTESLVLEYQTKLARYLRRMVGDAEAALDLTQEVFLSAYRMLSADPQRELSGGWLYRAATNAGISYLRRKKILRMLPLDREVEHPGASARTWRIDERSAASLDLQSALARLAPEQSAALLLTSYAGYSSTEAAAILGTTSDAVRQRVCRAMRVLRGIMKEGVE